MVKTTLRAFELSGEKVKQFTPVRLPSGAETTNARPKTFKDCPAKYVGKQVYESSEGFAPIFVSWVASDTWAPGMDQLFFSPKALGIDDGIIVGSDGSDMVRLENLLWVMDGPLLCEAVTGVDWDQLQFEIGEDDEKALAFKRQTQLGLWGMLH